MANIDDLIFYFVKSFLGIGTLGVLTLSIFLISKKQILSLKL